MPCDQCLDDRNRAGQQEWLDPADLDVALPEPQQHEGGGDSGQQAASCHLPSASINWRQ